MEVNPNVGEVWIVFGFPSLLDVTPVGWMQQEKHLASFKFVLGQFCSYEHVHDKQTVVEGPMPHV